MSHGFKLYISCTALFRILSKYTDSNNRIKISPSALEHTIILEIDSGKWIGRCFYDSLEKCAYNISFKWDELLREAKETALDLLEEREKLSNIDQTKIDQSEESMVVSRGMCFDI